jgi:uncharacterized membrane protein YczE
MNAVTATRIALVVVVGALAVWALRRNPVSASDLKLRLPRCIAGLACFGIGIACFFASGLGTGPWDVLHRGLSSKIGLPTGVVINLVGFAILPLWIPLKQEIGLGTVLNTLQIGLVVDVVKPLLPDSDHLLVRSLFAVSGLVIIAIGSGLYIGSGLGAGPRDGIMMGLKRLGLSVRAARTLIEAVTLTIGWLLGGKVGLGTVLFLVGIGPLVQISLKRLSLPPRTPTC